MTTAGAKSGTRGVWLMLAAMSAFAIQDGFSRYLASDLNTLMVVTIRYWIFAVFVLLRARQRPEGFKAAIRTRRLPTHFWRAVMLLLDICVMVYGYTLIGLIQSHAVFAVSPLLVVAFSGPLLGERLSPARWGAVGAGMVGVLIILNPGTGVFSWAALLPLSAAVLFALYGVLTRAVARDEPTFPAFFWPAMIGAVLMTPLGIWSWQPVQGQDWLFLLAYGGMSILANWLLTKTYEAAEASSVQPFAYFQTVFVAAIGIVVFHEALQWSVVLGAAVVIAAGLFALVIARQESRRAAVKASR